MITASTKQFGIRLDNAIADEYILMAKAKGVSPSTFLRELLTQNVHLALFKLEIYKLENSISEHTKKINEATQKISTTEQMNSEIARMYFMIFWMLKQQGCTIEKISDLIKYADLYYEKNYKNHT